MGQSRNFGGENFWARRALVSTVGLDDEHYGQLKWACDGRLKLAKLAARLSGWHAKATGFAEGILAGDKCISNNWRTKKQYLHMRIED